eukprot:1160544-Pelagomonas_calceolata.AAC.2
MQSILCAQEGQKVSNRASQHVGQPQEATSAGLRAHKRGKVAGCSPLKDRDSGPKLEAAGNSLMDTGSGQGQRVQIDCGQRQ